MTELIFTKTFLSTLDARSVKLQPDYIIPPKDLEIHSTYILPKMPTSMRKPTDSPSSKSGNVNITLRSSKNPTLELTLPNTDISSVTVLELKERVVKELNGAVEVGKVKVLWEKKPVSDAKTVKEVVGEKTGEVEFGLLVMGYKAPNSAAEAKEDGADKMDVDEKGRAELDEVFWGDLRGFLQQRLNDEGRAGEVLEAFKGAWERR